MEFPKYNHPCTSNFVNFIFDLHLSFFLIFSDSFGNLWYYNPGKNNREKWKHQAKFDKAKKHWYLLLHKFWLPWSKFCLWKADWLLGSFSTQVWDFSVTCYFPNTLSLMLFWNSWGNSCPNFSILEINSYFTCGKSNLHKNFALFQSIISKIACFISSKANYWKKWQQSLKQELFGLVKTVKLQLLEIFRDLIGKELLKVCIQCF